MTRRTRRRRLIIVLVLGSALLSACVANPLPPNADGDPVSIYMRNLTGEPIEFTMQPIGDPALMFEVPARDMRAGCATVPANWQLAQTEVGQPPGQGAVLRVVADDAPGADHRATWVVVTEAGATSGEGVPEWWSEGPQDGCSD